MSLVPSLLQAIVHVDGEALVMHAGDKPYVVSPTGQVDLATRGLALDAVNGIVNQLLPPELQQALDEFGAVQHELAALPEFPGEHFTIVAARGGDDVWVEIRRRRIPDEDRVPEELFNSTDAATSSPYPVYAAAGSPALARPVEPLPDSLELGDIGVERVEDSEAPSEYRTADLEYRESVEVEVAFDVPDLPLAAAEPTPPPVSPPVRESQAAIERKIEEAVVPAAPAPVVVAAPELAAPAVPAPPPVVAMPSPAPPVTPEPPALISTPAPVAPPAAVVPPAPAPVEATAAQHNRPFAGRSLRRPRRPNRRPRLPRSSRQRPRRSSSSRCWSPRLLRSPRRRPYRPSGLRRQQLARRLTSCRRQRRSPRSSCRSREIRFARSNRGRRSAMRERPVWIVCSGCQRRAARRRCTCRRTRGPGCASTASCRSLEGEPVLTARDVESLLLTLMPERNHEALRTGAATEWILDIEDVGRVRCMSFRDHRGPGGVFRLMPTRSVSVDQLGLPRAVQGLAIEPEGLVLVAGPRSSGKRTLISAFVDLINRTRRDHVITIEREINIVHERGNSFISQREVRGNDDDLLAAARAALREDPDVLVIEDLRSPRRS